MSARILFLDIETAPMIIAAWTPYEANAVWVERDTFILSFAAKWKGERSVKTYALPDYSRYKTHKHDDKQLVTQLRDMLDEADIVIAHNGDSFDIKKIRSRMLVHQLTPPSFFKTIDTLKIAKTCKFDSNKLDNLGRYLKEGRKIPNSGAHLWRGCCDGDAKSWRIMRRYNAQDVALLERVYERLKPWHNNHPNLNLYNGRSNCPTCQSGRIKSKGYQYLKSAVRRRYLCLSCSAQWSGELVRAHEAASVRATDTKTAPRLAPRRKTAKHRTTHAGPQKAGTSRRRRVRELQRTGRPR